jgi:hypothetical protein
MTDSEFEGELANRCTQHSALSKASMQAGAGYAALPPWMQLIWQLLAANLGSMAPGAALSALEKVGLPHNTVWNGAESWQVLHPLTVGPVINPV